jgi:hypothetical protein
MWMIVVTFGMFAAGVVIGAIVGAAGMVVRLKNRGFLSKEDLEMIADGKDK